MKRTGRSTEPCEHWINTAYTEMNVVWVCLMSWMCPDKYEWRQTDKHSIQGDECCASLFDELDVSWQVWMKPAEDFAANNELCSSVTLLIKSNDVMSSPMSTVACLMVTVSDTMRMIWLMRWNYWFLWGIWHQLTWDVLEWGRQSMGTDWINKINKMKWRNTCNFHLCASLKIQQCKRN